MEEDSTHPPPNDQIDSDLALAMQLQAMEEAEAMSQQKQDSDFLNLLKQQEQADMELAMKLQESEYNPPVKSLPPPLYTPPLRYDDNEARQPPSPEAIKRIMADYNEVLKAQNPQIHVHIDEDDVTHMSALIIGPEDTPYENGFFHFDLVFPHDYPWRPPKVTLMTTNNGTVRFNPNLYANGKVCLSILGTWQGPGWTSVQTIYSTLMSIQSLMNAAPYHNEPGFEVERNPGDVEAYNRIIQHETLRVAVCGMLENPTTDLFMDVMERHFLACYPKYIAIAEKYTDQDNKVMKDPFNEKRGRFGYQAIIERLKKIKAKLDAKMAGVSTAQTDSTPSDTKEAKSDSELAPVDKMDVDVPEPSETKDVGESKSEESNASPLATTFKSILKQLISEPPTNPPPLPPELLKFSSLISLISTATTKNANGEELITIPVPINPKKASNHKSARPGSSTKVKPPKLEELMQEEADADPDFYCLVCRGRPTEFITLPNCSQPHVYCTACANKLLQPPTVHRYGRFYGSLSRQKRWKQLQQTLSNKKQIQCVLCKSVNYVDAATGIDPLRRIRKRRKTSEMKPSADAASGMCPEHNDTIIMFCTEYMQLMCPRCLVSKNHSKHKDDKHLPLDDAAEQVSKQMMKAVEGLKQQRNEYQEFQQFVEQQRAKLDESVTQVQKTIRDKIEELKKLLDQKGEELQQQVRSVYNQKQQKIASALMRTKKRIADFDSCIDMAESSKSQLSSNPLGLLRMADENDDTWRQSLATPPPRAQASWFALPQLRMQAMEEVIKQTRYRDRMPSRSSLAALGIPVDSTFFDCVDDMVQTIEDGYDSEGYAPMDYSPDVSEEDEHMDEDEGPTFSFY